MNSDMTSQVVDRLVDMLSRRLTPETAVQFARRFAVLGGTPLNPYEDAAMRRQIKSHVSANTRI
jgi:hypothetical protein